DQLFISTTPGEAGYFRSQDPNVNAAMDFFGVDEATLQGQWNSLLPASPLAWTEALVDAARAHSTRMRLQDLQSHQLPADASLGLPAEPTLLQRVVAAGYNWSGSVSVGENVFAYAESVFHGHAAFAVDWGNTPNGIQNPAGHRDNIMDPNYTEIGIGIIQDSNPATTVGPYLVTQDFGRRGNYGDARLLGVIYTDGDLDHFYDAGEGAGGLTVTIQNGALTYTTTTMDAGGYQAAVAPGTYTVSVSGGNLQGNVFMGTVTVGSQNMKLDLDLSTVPTYGAIAGTVYGDTNLNGLFGPGESGLAGWSVYVDSDNDGQLDFGEASTTTDATGGYTFSQVATGTWTVRVMGQADYRATNPSTMERSVS
ncbi:MAG TPA: SdrD B-like domain-containing protein, partial [Pirellulaceae bacterium]